MKESARGDRGAHVTRRRRDRLRIAHVARADSSQPFTYMAPSASRERLSRLVSRSSRAHQPTGHRRFRRTCPACHRSLNSRPSEAKKSAGADVHTAAAKESPLEELQPFRLFSAPEECLRVLNPPTLSDADFCVHLTLVRVLECAR